MNNCIVRAAIWKTASRSNSCVVCRPYQCWQVRANQIRLYFSSAAYLLMQALRRLGLRGTQMATAQCNTIRLKLLKVGAQVKVRCASVDFTGGRVSVCGYLLSSFQESEGGNPSLLKRDYQRDSE